MALDINIHKNRTYAANPGPMGQMWADAKWSSCIADPAFGFGFFDDFTGEMGVPAAGANVLVGNWVGYSDAGSLITQEATELRGGLKMACDNTVNDANTIQRGPGAPYAISNLTGFPPRLLFEARAKVSTIADSQHSFFAGMAQGGLTALTTSLFADTTGVLTAGVDFIGFLRNHGAGNGAKLAFVYGVDGPTGMQTVIADLGPLVANTYISFGFIFDVQAPPSKMIRVFANNVEQTTYVTKAMIEAATFPRGTALQATIGNKFIANAVGSSSIAHAYAIQHN